MLPILAGYIAMSIGDRPALAVGFVGGALANSGGSGFLGALLAGFIAGYVVLGLKKLFDYLPDSLESPFSDSFSGNVVKYETISANYNKKLINLDSSYYVYDITGTIVNKNNEIDETKVTAFKTNYNINQDYNFPVVVNFVNGTVTSANSL